MAHIHPIIDSDVHFTVDPITRKITNMSKKYTLMQLDHESERFTFAMPRIIEGHDMTTCNRIEIHYINVNGKSKEKQPGVYEVRDIQAIIADDSSEQAIFTWLVSNNATKYAGALSFLVLFECVEDGKTLYRWSTDINTSIIISAGMDNSEAIEEIFIPDILVQWKRDLFEKNFAYEVALENGFEGTKKEWHDSMKGANGDTGIYVGAVKPPKAPYFWFDTSKYSSGDTIFIDVQGQHYSLENATITNMETVKADYDLTIE